MKSNIQTVKHRRKREGKTNYKRRIGLLTSKKHRLVVRRTNTKIITQIIDFELKGDKVKVGVDSTELKKLGWKGSLKNIPSAYLTGFVLGKKAIAAGIKDAILDIGLNTARHGTKIYAALKGAVDAGLKIPCSEDAFPSEERIQGKHIKEFANKIDEIKGAQKSKISGTTDGGKAK